MLSYILEVKPQLSEPVYGLKEWQPEDRPHQIGLVYYSFRVMIAIGVFLAALMAVTTLQWLRGKLSPENIARQKWLLRVWMLAAPLGYVAIESGWIVRCVGRQPWVVYGEVRTVDGVSNLPAGDVLTSLTAYIVVYSLLFIAALYFGSRIIRKGPNLNLPIPGKDVASDLETEPATKIPDTRPLEAQQ